MSLNPDLIKDFENAAPIIVKLVQHLDWLEDNFSPSEATEEERSIVKCLEQISYGKFNMAGYHMEQMFWPIKAEGRLIKNSRDKYEITGREFSCGSQCEVYLPYSRDDEDVENMTWIPTRIEHNGDDYYFTVRKNIPLEGALVRIRGFKPR